MIKNESAVALLPDKLGTWLFSIPVTTETVGETAHEATELSENIFDCFGDLVVPTEVRIDIQQCDSDIPLSNMLDRTTDVEVNYIGRNVSDQERVSFDDVRSTLPQENESAYIPSHFEVSNAKTYCRLQNGDVYVDKETNSGYYYDGELDSTTNGIGDPIDIRWSLSKTNDRDDIEAGARYDVFVSTWTDIWWEETEIGEVNKARLRSFLEKIETELPVVSTDCWGDGTSAARLQEIY